MFIVPLLSDLLIGKMLAHKMKIYAKKVDYLVKLTILLQKRLSLPSPTMLLSTIQIN